MEESSFGSSNLLSAAPSQNELLKSNFQNMAILETSEDNETTRKAISTITVDLGDDYDNQIATLHLDPKERAYLSNRTKIDIVQCKNLRIYLIQSFNK